MDASETPPPATLTDAEAVALLRTARVGRLVYTRRALPAVTLVNYGLRDGAIWIWAASASSMAQAVRGAVVAFEVDELDIAVRSGWSVTMLGVAELVIDGAEIERALELGPEPWVPGRKEHLIRIPLKLVTGRRILPTPREGEYALANDASVLAKGVP
jgi:uncharacterized protein